jgi:hypothetical protein
MRCGSISIGVVEYADAAYNSSEMRLRYAVADAEAFHRYMSLAWPQSEAGRHCLLADGNAISGKIDSAIAALNRSQSYDLFVLYLSGHGDIGADGSGWFCLADAVPGSPSLDGIALDKYLAAIEADFVLAFVDCCHAEAVVAGSRAFSIRENRRARMAVTSCRAAQRAWEDDGLRRSIFSDILLRALSTDSPLADARGQVDFQAQLLPYLRDQVPVAASTIKRGQNQEPVTAGFISGPLMLPVISSTSLGRPLTLPQAIRAGVRRFLVAGLLAATLFLAAAELLIYHLAVDATGEILVRPGFSATYNLVPFHLIGGVDTGLSISDVASGDDSTLAALAAGSLWGVATHRDGRGLKPWLSSLEGRLTHPASESLRALAFAEAPRLNVDDDRPPTVEALFISLVEDKSAAEVAASVYPYDPALSWSCSEQASNRLDFTRLSSTSEVFEQDLRWLAATAPEDANARAKRLIDVVKLTAYRALHEKDGEARVTEFDAFANAIAKIARFDLTGSSDTAAAAALEATKGTWCALYSSYASALHGAGATSSSGEEQLWAVVETFDRAKDGDAGSAEVVIAVHGLVSLSRYRPLSAETLASLYKRISETDGNIEATNPLMDMLAGIARSQKLNDDLITLLLDNLRTEKDSSDFAPLKAANLLARNSAFLNVNERARLKSWLSEAAGTDALVSQLHEALGFFALTEPLASDQIDLLVSRLSSLTRFPPRAMNYRGEMIIQASGDEAAVALGRLAQSISVRSDVAERLANFAAARTDLKDGQEILNGLARQWYGDAHDLSARIYERLERNSKDAVRRSLEVDVAAAAARRSLAPMKKDLAREMLGLWKVEVEPSTRIALARVAATLNEP